MGLIQTIYTDPRRGPLAIKSLSGKCCSGTRQTALLWHYLQEVKMPSPGIVCKKGQTGVPSGEFHWGWRGAKLPQGSGICTIWSSECKSVYTTCQEGWEARVVTGEISSRKYRKLSNKAPPALYLTSSWWILILPESFQPIFQPANGTRVCSLDFIHPCKYGGM